MPEFVHPFAGLAADRKITQEELARAIRFSIAAEYEAVQLYQQLAESTDNSLAQEVLRDIADEELVHVGEFLRLLKELAPNEAAFYAEGEAEVEEMIAALAGGNPSAGTAGTPTEIETEMAPEAEVASSGNEENQPADKETTSAVKETPSPTSPKGIGNLFERS